MIMMIATTNDDDDDDDHDDSNHQPPTASAATSEAPRQIAPSWLASLGGEISIRVNRVDHHTA
jgi:hypothetical protein